MNRQCIREYFSQLKVTVLQYSPLAHLLPDTVRAFGFTIGFRICQLCLIGRAKRTPHWGVQSRFRVIYIYVVGMSVVCQINCVGGITYGPRACSKSFFGG